MRFSNGGRHFFFNLWIFNTLFYLFIFLPLDWIGGYGGGGLIQVPSGRLICRRSDENSAKYCSAGITLKNLLSRSTQSRWMQWMCSKISQRRSEGGIEAPKERNKVRVWKDKRQIDHVIFTKAFQREEIFASLNASNNYIRWEFGMHFPHAHTHLWCSGLSAKSDLKVSVTYLWKYVGNGSVVSRSNIRHRVGVGLCIKNTW